ncbi:MAG: GNAT family N-acetyltransferase, partial [Pauljensenia sp.]
MSAPASADRSVRPAQRGDEAAIAPLQLASWRALMGEETLAAQGVSEESLARLWGRTLARPRP